VRTGVTEWPVLLGQVPPVGEFFVARQETGLGLDGMPVGSVTVLAPAADHATGLQTLGGTGKTCLAAALAHAHYENSISQLVLWISASGPDAVISGYAQAVRELDEVPQPGENPERAAGRFLSWLARAEQPWLVVLDDLSDPAAVDGWWPSGGAGRVVVTSGQPDIAAAYHPRTVPVGAFSAREALAYLFARLQVDPGQRAGALDLATELGFGPVALAHAGAVMAATGLDCRDYHARFTERRQALAHAFPTGFASTVAATWSLSCGLADEMAPRGMAGRVLALMSVLSSHGIPGLVLTTPAARAYLSGAEGFLADETHVHAALRNLARTGMVTLNDRSPARTVGVHQLVSELARRHLDTAETERVARAAAEALGQAWSGPEVAPPVAQALRDCTAALQEAAGTLLWEPQCHTALVRAGQSLNNEGLSGPAVSYWRTMFGVSRQVLGSDHPQTINARDYLGNAYEGAGNLNEAIAIYEAALADRRRALGPGHPSTRDACERLTRTYLAIGRASDAIRLAEAAHVACEQSLGPDSPATLTASATLASAYLAADRVEDATAAFQHVLTRREHMLGPNHPDTLSARASLADACREAKRFKEAIALARRTLADRERWQGPDHPDTIAARASLAAAYRGANKLKESFKLFERILADRERVQGPDHPDTILARCDLGLACLQTKKLAKAIPLYERAVTDAERILGPNHPITTSARQNLDEAGAYAWAVLGIDLRSHKGKAN
jgi:tetratricopeptide (TPR) repeat protein